MRNRIPKRSSWRRLALTALLLPLVALATLTLAGAARAAPIWQPPLTLSAPGQEADEPELTFDRQGNVLAVWRQSGSDGGILAALRSTGAGFGAPQTISSTGGAPQVAFDAHGEAIAVWHRRSQRTGDCGLCVEASFRPAGGSFGAPERVPATGADPQLAVDPAGNALVLVRHPGGIAKLISASFRPAGGRFEAGQKVAGGLVGSPRVAFDSRGRATAIWARGVRIQSAFRPRGGAFGKPRFVAGGDLPELAVDRRGNALAVWRRGVFPNSRVQAAFRPADGRFGRAQTISGPDAGDETHVAFDRRGNALVVWWRRNRNGGNSRVQAAFRPAGGRFGRPQTISRQAEAVGSIRLAFGPRGDALAVWEDLELDRSLIPTSSRIRTAAFVPDRPRG